MLVAKNGGKTSREPRKFRKRQEGDVFQFLTEFPLRAYLFRKGERVPFFANHSRYFAGELSRMETKKEHHFQLKMGRVWSDPGFFGDPDLRTPLTQNWSRSDKKVMAAFLYPG